MAKSTATPKAATGRTHWKRFALAVTPATAATAGLVIAAASGAMAVSFAVSGTAFKVSADKLTAHDVVQFGSLTNPKSGGPQPIVLSGFKSAELENLCQSVRIPIPLINKSAVLTIKTPKTATAQNMVADLAQLGGDATFTNVDIGVDASATTRGPDVGPRPAGMFGQQVQTVEVVGARQIVYGVSASEFKLPNMQLSVNFDNQECF
jgi:hypothetical protein